MSTQESRADRPLPLAGSRLLAEIHAAETAERARLVRALHDDGLQMVLAARQELDAALAGDVAAADRVRWELDQLMLSLRSITQAADDDFLGRISLTAAVNRLGQLAAARGRLRVTVEVDSEAEGRHDQLLVGVVRELLANCVRHAQAGAVSIAVRSVDAMISVEADDDGIGVLGDALHAADQRGQMGLRGLRRTAGELGGRLVIEPRPRGTWVSLQLPVDALVAQRVVDAQNVHERRWAAALIAGFRDGLVMVHEGLIVQASTRFCELVDRPGAELTGFTLADRPFWPEELDVARLLDRLRTSLTHEQITLRRPDGSTAEVFLTGSVLDGDFSDGGGLVLIFRRVPEVASAPALP